MSAWLNSCLPVDLVCANWINLCKCFFFFKYKRFTLRQARDPSQLSVPSLIAGYSLEFQIKVLLVSHIWAYLNLSKASVLFQDVVLFFRGF